MGLKELAGRISQSGAKTALIVSMFKGNPRDIQFMDPSGKITATITLESAILRREVSEDVKTRTKGISSISVAENSSQRTRNIAAFIAGLLDMEVHDREAPVPVGKNGAGFMEYWFTDLPSGKVLWTIYHTVDAQEIGPRIRILQMKR